MERRNLPIKILASAFDLLYHQFAWSYDIVAWVVSSGKWHGWTRTALEQLDPDLHGLIVELGFGPGHLQLDLAKRGFHSIGIDESRHMSRIACRRLKTIKAGKKISRLVRGKAENLPLSDGCAVVLLATFPAEYIFRDQTIANWYRVLTTNGKIIILMGVEPGSFSIINMLLRSFYRLSNAEFKNLLGPHDYLERIRAHGFIVESKPVSYKKDRLWFIHGQKV